MYDRVKAVRYDSLVRTYLCGTWCRWWLGSDIWRNRWGSALGVGCLFIVGVLKKACFSLNGLNVKTIICEKELYWKNVASLALTGDNLNFNKLCFMCILFYLKISHSLSSVLDRFCFCVIQEKFVIFLYLSFLYHIVCFSLGLIWKITSSNIPTYYPTNAREFGHVIYANFKGNSRLFWRNQWQYRFEIVRFLSVGEAFLVHVCMLLCSERLNCINNSYCCDDTKLSNHSFTISALPQAISHNCASTVHPIILSTRTYSWFLWSDASFSYLRKLQVNSLLELLLTLLKVGGINMPAFVFHSFLCVPIESFPCLFKGKKHCS